MNGRADKLEETALIADFFSAIKEDYRISITHIGIYVALISYWRAQGFRSPVYAFSRDIMKIAKISAPGTYHKRIKELAEYGYITYEPSFDRTEGSMIFFRETPGDQTSDLLNVND